MIEAILTVALYLGHLNSTAQKAQPQPVILHKEAKPAHCSKTAISEPPALWYYMDGDGTPVDVAYSDYLSDFDWWLNEEATTFHNRLCEGAFQPEPFAQE